jgi:hypothetical protein
MKNTNIQDERIITQRRKIQSDAYQILLYCLIISIMIQQFILNAPFSQFAVEFFCLIGCGIYMSIRHLTVGIDLWSSSTFTLKKVFINGAVTGAISVVALAILAGQRNIVDLAIFFLSFTALYVISNFILQYLSQKKQKRIDEKLNLDETND